MGPTNNAGNKRRIRETLYQLKLDFGVLCDVYKLVSSETDYDTGLKDQTIESRRVRRAVRMPQSIARQQYISPNFTQTNKNFITKGLGWDEVTDVFVFDGRDLRNYEFDLSDWIIWNHIRYGVKAIEELGDKDGWYIGVTQAKGAPPYEFHIVDAASDMGLDGSAEATIV